MPKSSETFSLREAMNVFYLADGVFVPHEGENDIQNDIQITFWDTRDKVYCKEEWHIGDSRPARRYFNELFEDE